MLLSARGYRHPDSEFRFTVADRYADRRQESRGELSAGPRARGPATPCARRSRRSRTAALEFAGAAAQRGSHQSSASRLATEGCCAKSPGLIERQLPARAYVLAEPRERRHL